MNSVFYCLFSLVTLVVDSGALHTSFNISNILLKSYIFR